MGKRKGKRKATGEDKSNERKNKAKRQKFQKSRRFWIEQCKDRKVSKNIPSSLVFPVTISRVELTDDHTHAGKISIKLSSVKEQKEDKDTTCANTKSVVSGECEPDGHIKVISPKAADNAKQNADDERNDKESDAKNDETTKPCDPGTTMSASPIVPSTEITSINKESVEEETHRDPFIRIIRAQSAKGELKTAMDSTRIKSLPNGDNGDGIINPFPKDEVADKYWAQRKRLFSKFDEGVQLDKESWYSVTPEAIAGHIAQRISTTVNSNENRESGIVVLDAFCGVGGNGLAFALQKDISQVICVDIDREKLKMAANNASIYNVEPSKIVFIEGNAIDILRLYENGNMADPIVPKEKSNVNKEDCHGYTIISGNNSLPTRIDCVFLSPPWGGVDYLKVGNANYELSKCIKIASGNPQNETAECDGESLLDISSNAAKKKSVVYFLPKNVNGFNIGKSAWKIGYRTGIEMEQNFLNGKLKTVTVYLNES